MGNLDARPQFTYPLWVGYSEVRRPQRGSELCTGFCVATSSEGHLDAGFAYYQSDPSWNTDQGVYLLCESKGALIKPGGAMKVNACD